MAIKKKATKSKKSKKVKSSFRKRVFKLFLTAFLIIVVGLGLFITMVGYGFFGHVYSKEELADFKNQTASLVYTSDGMLIGKFFAENRTNIKYSDIPQHLVDALIATEDARYFEHKGIDTWSLLRVFFKTLLLNQKSSGGGSTLSQQLSKNMYGRADFGPLTMPVNKCKEAILAYKLESIYDKKEVLTLYFNTVPFGENVFGIEAASRRFYGKPTSRLTTDEGAVLVGMLKANTYYNPRLHPENALNRRNVVLDQMLKYGYLKQSEAEIFKNQPLKLNYANLKTEGPANYFLAEVKKKAQQILKDIRDKGGKEWDLEKDELVINTTLDGKLQKYALQSFSEHLSSAQKRLRQQYSGGQSKKKLNSMVNSKMASLNIGKDQRAVYRKQEVFDWKGFYTDSLTVEDSLKLTTTLLHAGMLAIDPLNGGVKCWVGGIHHGTQPHDQIKAYRPLASTFKPVLFASALENGRSPCKYLENDSITFPEFDNWTPRNYDKSYGGKFSMPGALAKSMNVPSVNLYLETGFEQVDYVWKKLGFSKKVKNLPSSALGTASANLIELARAYAVFANGGYDIKLHFISSIKTSNGDLIYTHEETQNNRIIKAETAALINVMLQKAVDSGTGRSMRGLYGVNLPLAGKTGTAQNHSDAWFAAYNPSLVMVTRVGASSPSIHFNSGVWGSGSKLALPLVAKTLFKVQNNSKLRKLYSGKFKSASIEIMEQLNCPDFKEKSKVEEIFDIFKDNEVEIGKEKKKKRSFLDRLFGRKKK